MARKYVKYFSKRTGKIQFQVGCMSFTTLKKTSHSNRKLKNLCFNIWRLNVTINEKGDEKWHFPFPWNYCVIREQEVSCILGIRFFSFLEKYVCINSLFIQKENKLSLTHNIFKYNSYEQISGIEIPEMLLNIVSCYGLYKKIPQ